MHNKLFLFYRTPYVDLTYVRQLGKQFYKLNCLKYKFVFDKELNSRLVSPDEFSRLYPGFNIVYILPNPYNRVAKFYIENLSKSKYSRNMSEFVYNLRHQDLPPLNSFIPSVCDFIRIDHMHQDLEDFAQKYKLRLEDFDNEHLVDYSKIFRTELKQKIKQLYQEDFDMFW
jgi:hypothetical protein